MQRPLPIWRQQPGFAPGAQGWRALTYAFRSAKAQHGWPELAEGDIELRNRLLLDAASAGTGPIDAASYRRSFSDALRSGSAARRHGPRTSGAWARGVHQVTESIGALLEAGHAEEVIGITEYALGRVDVNMSRVDDSSGWFSQVLMDLEVLHHAACEAVRPDPIALARKLFAMEVDTEWDILIDSAKRYADLLGDEGLAEMRRLADERWSQLPPVDPDRRRSGERHFHLTRMMETDVSFAKSGRGWRRKDRVVEI